MKIVAVIDDENCISPLEFGSSIMLMDQESGDINVYENPGFGAAHGGKERAMAGILTLNADAMIVKEGILCPGSYHMSRGKMKYIPAGEMKFDDIVKNLNTLSSRAVDELDPLMYRE